MPINTRSKLIVFKKLNIELKNILIEFSYDDVRENYYQNNPENFEKLVEKLLDFNRSYRRKPKKFRKPVTN